MQTFREFQKKSTVFNECSPQFRDVFDPQWLKNMRKKIMTNKLKIPLWAKALIFWPKL